MDEVSMTELSLPSETIEQEWHRHARAHARTAKMVVTRTPLRISFAGGGTDLPEFYEVEEGAVLSAAGEKYVYSTVKPHSELFNEPIRLNYSRTEQVNTIRE